MDNLQRLHSVLEETYAGNFVVYYRAHQAHINVIGRSFYNDHKLLQKIYEQLQSNVDVLGEKLRTCRATAPACIDDIISVSLIPDLPITGDAGDLLEGVNEGIEALIDQYKELYDAAEEASYIDISNFAQDQVGVLAKFRWMLESTLES